MLVRFAVICDKCKKRSEEYGGFPTCKECQEHICPDCDIPSERTEDERDLTLCKGCAAEIDRPIPDGYEEQDERLNCNGKPPCGHCDICDERSEVACNNYDIEVRGK